MPRQNPIPVIDLFAGPGGLGEGFTSIADGRGDRRFAVKVSIEKEEVAQRTLSLRALFRAYRKGAAPDCYYDYLSGVNNSWWNGVAFSDSAFKARR